MVEMKFLSKAPWEVHGDGQDTAWSQTGNQTPKNSKHYWIIIRNNKILIYN